MKAEIKTVGTKTCYDDAREIAKALLKRSDRVLKNNNLYSLASAYDKAAKILLDSSEDK